MVSVTVGNNVTKEVVLVESTATLKSALERKGISTTSGVFQLNGETISNSDLDKSFADFGITDSCFLLNVKKVDNAA